MQPKPASHNRDVFSAQLWKAVGLQPKSLSIPRVHFFPEEAASVCCVPSCSRGSEERQGQHSNSNFTDAHKRRRNVGNTSCYDDDVAIEPARRALEASYQAPDLDLEAMMQAPRRPRTDRSRRPLRDLHRLAAECPLPSMESDEETAPGTSGMQQQQQQQQGYHQGEASPQRDAHSTQARQEQQQEQQHGVHQCTAQPQPSTEAGWESPAHAQDSGQQCGVPSPICQLADRYWQEEPAIQLASGLARKAAAPAASPEPPEVRTSTKDSPASHSAESSLGVYLDLQDGGGEQEEQAAEPGSASPGNSTGQDHVSKRHHHHLAWSQGSPMSEDAD